MALGRMKVKHYFMTLIWRVQQSQSLIAPLFYAATLTGVFWPIVGDYLRKRGWPPSNVALGLGVLFFSTLFLILLMGVIYDKVFKLWREQVDVGVERNPYMQEKLAPKEILLWKKMHLRTLEQVAQQDPRALEDAEFMERWIQKSMEDPRIRAQVEALERWIEGPPSGPSREEGGAVVTTKAASRDQR